MGQLITNPKSNIYLDTNIWVSYLDNEAVWHEQAKELVQEIADKECHAYVSMLMYTEYLTGYAAELQGEIYQSLYNLLNHHPYIDVVGIDENIVLAAAKLRRQYNIATPAAVHLATALEKQCQVLITRDQQLKSVTELQVIIPE